MGPLKMVLPAHRCQSSCAPLGALCARGSEFPKSFPCDWPASASLCPQVDQTTFPHICRCHALLASPRSMAARVSINFHMNLPRASSTYCPSFPKVSCESTSCLIHILPEFHQSFQWILSRGCSLRAIASRTALPWVRSVLEGLSFPKVSHVIGQLLPASAPRSTKPRSLARAAVMYGRQFREGFGQFASCWQVLAPWQH